MHKLNYKWLIPGLMVISVVLFFLASHNNQPRKELELGGLATDKDGIISDNKLAELKAEQDAFIASEKDAVKNYKMIPKETAVAIDSDTKYWVDEYIDGNGNPGYQIYFQKKEK
jgi:hypothetical protein